MPRYVKDEFDAFPECGFFAHGFLRLHCGGCNLHCLVLHGVYRAKPDGELTFIQASVSTDQELQLLLRAIVTSIMKRLVRQGVLVKVLPPN